MDTTLEEGFSYNITCEKIDENNFKCTVSYDNSDIARKTYKQYTGAMSYRVAVDYESVLTLEQFGTFLAELERHNKDDNIRDQNADMMSKIIYALENADINEELFFKIFISQHHTNEAATIVKFTTGNKAKLEGLAVAIGDIQERRDKLKREARALEERIAQLNSKMAVLQEKAWTLDLIKP